MLSRLFKNVSWGRAAHEQSSPMFDAPARKPNNPQIDHPPEPLRFVVATRKTAPEFHAVTATGRSLAFHGVPPGSLRLFPNNTHGLAKIYNIAIEESVAEPAILVFLHDDVHLLDFDLPKRLRAAVNEFQIVGVAGNKRRLRGQPAWAFINDAFTMDSLDNLSGVVGHGTGFPPSNLSRFGPPGQQVKLLDGLMLFAKSATMHDCGLRFDERFEFHFYDMDFCRQAELKGISMGTWPISVIHESMGTFGSKAWRAAHRLYVDKWQD